MTALLYNNILHYNGARRIRDNPPRGFRGKKRRGGQNARDNGDGHYCTIIVVAQYDILKAYSSLLYGARLQQLLIKFPRLHSKHTRAPRVGK